MPPNTGGPANSERRWSYSKHEWVVGVNHGPPFHAAKQVLSDFRDQFIADVDARIVVWELLYLDIIPRDVHEMIIRTKEPKQQNEILHDYLQRACTEDDLIKFCHVILQGWGNPRMQRLSAAMMRRLHSDICAVC